MTTEQITLLITEWGTVLIAVVGIIASCISAIRKIKNTDGEATAKLEKILKKQEDMERQLSMIAKENIELKRTFREKIQENIRKPVTIPRDGKR